MDNMKRYFRTYKILRREVERQEARLAELERIRRRPLLRGEGKGREEIEAMVQARRQEVVRSMEAMLIRSREIEALIGRVEGATEEKTWLYRQILGCHYIDGMTFARIADALHYHERHVRRLHQAGLAAAAKAMERGDTHDVE